MIYNPTPTLVALIPGIILSIFLSGPAVAQGAELFDAIKNQDVASVKAILAKVPGLVKARNKRGDTPLHYVTSIHVRGGKSPTESKQLFNENNGYFTKSREPG